MFVSPANFRLLIPHSGIRVGSLLYRAVKLKHQRGAAPLNKRMLLWDRLCLIKAGRMPAVQLDVVNYVPAIPPPLVGGVG